MQKITTFLAFNDKAEEAINLYVSTFKNSKILSMQKIPVEAPGTTGNMIVATFELDGEQYMAMNAGPYFTFSQGISLMVNCETQAEIDHFWEKLGEGGEIQACGWLKDRFGVSWQIVPTAIGRLMGDPKSGNTKAVMDALMQMVKIDLATLEKAYAQK